MSKSSAELIQFGNRFFYKSGSFILHYKFPIAKTTEKIIFPEDELFEVLKLEDNLVTLKYAERIHQNFKCFSMVFEKESFVRLFQMVASDCLALPAKAVNNDMKHITKGATLEVLYKSVFVQTNDPKSPKTLKLIYKQKVQVSNVMDDSFVIDFVVTGTGMVSVNVFCLNAHIFGLVRCDANVSAKYGPKINELLTSRIDATTKHLETKMEEMVRKQIENFKREVFTPHMTALQREVEEESQKMFREVQGAHANRKVQLEHLFQMRKNQLDRLYEESNVGSANIRLKDENKKLKEQIVDLKKLLKRLQDSEVPDEPESKRVKIGESSTGGGKESAEAWRAVEQLACDSGS